MTQKTGKPANNVSYIHTPIIFLPDLSKLFEKLVLRSILPLLLQNKAIPDHQFGFREQHSTVEQIHRVFNKIRRTLENKG